MLIEAIEKYCKNKIYRYKIKTCVMLKWLISEVLSSPEKLCIQLHKWLFPQGYKLKFPEWMKGAEELSIEDLEDIENM